MLSMEVCKAVLAGAFPLQSVRDSELPYNGQLRQIERKSLGKVKKKSSGKISYLIKRGVGGVVKDSCLYGGKFSLEKETLWVLHTQVYTQTFPPHRNNKFVCYS